MHSHASARIQCNTETGTPRQASPRPAAVAAPCEVPLHRRRPAPFISEARASLLQVPEERRGGMEPDAILLACGRIAMQHFVDAAPDDGRRRRAAAIFDRIVHLAGDTGQALLRGARPRFRHACTRPRGRGGLRPCRSFAQPVMRRERRAALQQRCQVAPEFAADSRRSVGGADEARPTVPAFHAHAPVVVGIAPRQALGHRFGLLLRPAPPQQTGPSIKEVGDVGISPCAVLHACRLEFAFFGSGLDPHRRNRRNGFAAFLNGGDWY